MAIERTLVLLKPDAIQRGVCGEIITRLERSGLKVAGMKMIKMNEELAKRHYRDHVAKPFFPGLLKFITSGPLIALVVEGREAVETVRKLMGSTDPVKAAPGTIRADLAQDINRNLVHGSADPFEANREINIYFTSQEVFAWKRANEEWVIES